MLTLTFQENIFNISDLSIDEAKRLIDDAWSIFYQDSEDSHWVWQKKVLEAESDYFSEVKRIQIAGQDTVEAVIWYKNNAQSFLEENSGAIYISMLSVAPWNRHSTSPRKLTGMGTLIMQYVIWRSLNLGFKGRIILESLPEAEQFYLKLGFVDIGIVSSEKLKYFELPPNKADELLEGFEYEK